MCTRIYLGSVDILMFQAAAKAVQNDKNSEFALAPEPIRQAQGRLCRMDDYRLLNSDPEPFD
jgi:hypothetical protein